MISRPTAFPVGLVVCNAQVPTGIGAESTKIAWGLPLRGSADVVETWESRRSRGLWPLVVPRRPVEARARGLNSTRRFSDCDEESSDGRL
jgi:hypothetical protein